MRIVLATILLLIVAASSPAAAEASATRDLPGACVDPNAEFTVTISASDYGTIGEVAETLCDGWIYTGSSLADSQVEEDGNTVKFYMFAAKSFTYTVRAPSTEGDCCTISGTLTEQSQSTSPVVGAAQVCVCEGDAATTLTTTVESPDGGESTGGVVVTTPVATPTETGTQPVSEEAVTSAPSVTPTESMTPAATSTKKLATKPDASGMVPGFGAIFAVAGLLAVAYLFRRR